MKSQIIVLPIALISLLAVAQVTEKCEPDLFETTASRDPEMRTVQILDPIANKPVDWQFEIRYNHAFVEGDIVLSDT